MTKHHHWAQLIACSVALFLLSSAPACWVMSHAREEASPLCAQPAEPKKVPKLCASPARLPHAQGCQAFRLALLRALQALMCQQRRRHELLQGRWQRKLSPSFAISSIKQSSHAMRHRLPFPLQQQLKHCARHASTAAASDNEKGADGALANAAQEERSASSSRCNLERLPPRSHQQGGRQRHLCKRVRAPVEALLHGSTIVVLLCARGSAGLLPVEMKSEGVWRAS